MFAQRSAALEKTDLQPVARRLERQPQGRGGRLARAGQRPQHEKKRLPGLRCHMQASQQVMIALAQARLPHQQGLAAVGPQDLLGGPAGVGRMIGLQLQQP